MMKRLVWISLFVFMWSVTCAVLAFAQDSKKSDEANLRKQAEQESQVRVEYEKRKHWENYHHDSNHSTSNTPVSVATTSVNAGAANSQIRPSRKSFGLLYAPGNGQKSGAVGFIFMGSERKGAAGWFSGNLWRKDEVIDTSIPHTNFRTEETKGTYGLQYLQGAGSGSMMLILGVGVSVQQTLLTDVSNATGWKWDGGEKYDIKPSAQAGCRMRLSDGFGMHLGWDTGKGAYFGIGGEF